jgi:uncharacterized protein
MRIEWDEAKNRRNLLKHAVRFETAALAFEDPYALTQRDESTTEEERWITLGSLGPATVLFVVHTWRERSEEEIVRIIWLAPRHRARGIDMRKLTKEQKRDIAAIAAMKDEDIDLFDMPEVLDWSKAEMGKFYRPPKRSVTMRLDGDVILHGNRNRSFRSRDGPVQRVALDGFAAGGADQALQLFAAHALRRGRAGIVINLFFDHRAVHVVSAEAQGNLRHLWRHHLPVRLDVREVVEHQAADGDLLHVEHAGGLRQMLQRRVIRMESQRDEGLEAAGFILQGAQLEQVVDAVFVVLDVAVEHGRVRLQPDLVSERAVSSHWSPSILWSQMMWRTRSAKISAPPPGSESTPEALSCSSVSRIESLAASTDTRPRPW